MEEIAVSFHDWARDMKLYIWFGFVIIMQDVTILGQKDKKRIWLKAELRTRVNGFVWDDAALPPSPIRDLQSRCQFRCS